MDLLIEIATSWQMLVVAIFILILLPTVYYIATSTRRSTGTKRKPRIEKRKSQKYDDENGSQPEDEEDND